ncbi:hypothetical protein NQ314_002496 [Rhamnusium bicolor]|uniref:Protein BCCIP homolog n=1 Tax=Rhamnusium bicolor TaxID=1586634 RepID=A0AAV8ZPI4_9CUCU|nr:hypothetical protein NQ314_002496 [Rhamnusium bicolor]
MAGPTKKTRRPVEADSDNDSMSEESESGTYHGQQLFLKAHIDLSQMSDLLIAQHGIGSVLKQSYNDSDDEDADMSEERDVFGITSVINLTSHKENPCVQQLYSLLDEISLKHADSVTQDGIKKILSQSKRLGFLVNERFVNIPAKISVVMLNSIYEEIERMKKKDGSYNFEYYIMICKTCRPKENKDSEEIFSNDEEAIFSNEAEINFEFSVADESDTGLGGKWLSEDKQVVPYRRILIFKADKFKNIIAQVTAFVN